MKNNTLQLVTDVISKPPRLRTDDDVTFVLNWLCKTADIFRDINKDVMCEIVRQCECLDADKDDLIMAQGDKGDCMYIVLRGKVSVYVNSGPIAPNSNVAAPKVKIKVPQKKKENTDPGPKSENKDEGESEDAKEPTSPSAEPIKSILKISPRDKTQGTSGSLKSLPDPNTGSRKESLTRTLSLRSMQMLQQMVKTFSKCADKAKLGKHCAHYEAGESFGEVALMAEGSVRSASVVCDDPSVFLVVRKHLYNNTLKTYHEKEYEMKKNFIKSHPMFRGWNPRLRQLLEVTLYKQSYNYGEAIVKQGDRVKGLLFMKSGDCTVQTEPGKHDLQYEDRVPFKAEEDVYEVVFDRKKKVIEKVYLDEKGYSEFDHIHVRRREGYVAAEKRIKSKTLTLCSIQPGDIIGDIEYIIGLPTYMHTIISNSKTEVYRLSKANLERLLGISGNTKLQKQPKLAQQTFDNLKTIADVKLSSRLDSLPDGSEVPLLNHLLFELRKQGHAEPMPIPEVKTSKELPDRETLFYHMLAAFMEDRAALVEPHTKGGAYLKELTREKARERARADEARREKAMPLWLKDARKQTKHPRTMKVLKAALEQQKTERDKLLYKQQLEQELESHEAEIKESGLSTDQLKIFFKAMDSNPALISENTMFRIEPPPPPPEEKKEENKEGEEEKEKEKQPETDQELLERSDTFMTRIQPERLSNPDKSAYQDLVPSTGDMIKSESVEHINLHIGDSTVDNTPRSEVEVKKKRRTLDAFEDARQTAQSRVKSRLIKPLTENPAYRDWETSENTLNYLEHRVKMFALSYGAEKGQITTLPKLRRFEAPGFIPKQPKQGGKVYVRHHPCPAQNKDVRLTNHEHSRYHMLPAIQNCDQMRKARMAAHIMLNTSREKWIQRHKID